MTIGLAPRRPSRVLLAWYVLAWVRCPVRLIEWIHYPPLTALEVTTVNEQNHGRAHAGFRYYSGRPPKDLLETGIQAV